jgi:hypothetical protein
VDHIDNVPVKLQGIQIGTAKVNADGSILMALSHRSNVGMEIYQQLLAGFIYGLSIGPIINPAVDGNLISRTDCERDIPPVTYVDFGFSENELDRFKGRSEKGGGTPSPFPKGQDVHTKDGKGLPTEDTGNSQFPDR